MPNPEEKPQKPATEAEAMAKALEIELMQKRAAWQQARGNRGVWRALSILFLVLVLLGALVAYFYLIPGLVQREGERPSTETKNGDR